MLHQSVAACARPAAVHEEATVQKDMGRKVGWNSIEKKPDTDCVANILATHSILFDPW